MRVVIQLLWMLTESSFFAMGLVGVRLRAEVIPLTASSNAAIAPTLQDKADPCLGIRWRIVMDTEHPGYPPRLIQVDQLTAPAGRIGWSSNGMSAKADPASHPSPATGTTHLADRFKSLPPVIIRAGDHIWVDQDFPRLHARLEATALGSAAAGEMMPARLAVQHRSGGLALGPVVRVKAIESGRAQWARDIREDLKP